MRIVKSSSYNGLEEEWLLYHFKTHLKAVEGIDFKEVFKHLDKTDQKRLCAMMETIAVAVVSKTGGKS